MNARRTSLREEQKKQTRARLVEAARQLFAEQGYGAVRIDDIAAVVGCSRATFYLYFNGKVDVLREIGAEATSMGVARSFENLEHALRTDSRTEFVAWVRQSIAWFEENKDLLPAWDEAAVLEPEFRAVAREGIAAMATGMTGYLSRWPADRREEAALRVELLVAQLERFFTRWALHGTIDVSAERAAEVLADIWFPALRIPGTEPG
ncbi:TetR/AcrR family transcriptional regulator [Nocardia stercoris]|uniref:TetR/AcrR family transcriptional regulator n=1 Tax=Nocardia stercoris TaxID=2483361 RepID=UPI001F23006B|nr:TetR/AcrR family transcriptional regulator [Nocardia stercoris]